MAEQELAKWQRAAEWGAERICREQREMIAREPDLAAGVDIDRELAGLRAEYLGEIKQLASIPDTAEAIKALRQFMADLGIWEDL
jgi:hypothetical protein